MTCPPRIAQPATGRPCTATHHPPPAPDNPPGKQDRSGKLAVGVWERVSGGGADERAEAHQRQPDRHPPTWLLTEQHPGALQEAVDRQRRRRARAAGLLLVFLAAASGAGGQARDRERGDRSRRHQAWPDPRIADTPPRVREQVQPRDDEQRACGRSAYRWAGQETLASVRREARPNRTFYLPGNIPVEARCGTYADGMEMWTMTISRRLSLRL